MYNILCNKPQFAESPENRLDAQREGARSKVGRPAELQSGDFRTQSFKFDEIYRYETMIYENPEVWRTCW